MIGDGEAAGVALAGDAGGVLRGVVGAFFACSDVLFFFGGIMESTRCIGFYSRYKSQPMGTVKKKI